MYVYCVVCCLVTAAICKNVGCVFAYLYMLVDDIVSPLDYELSLLPKIVSLFS